MSCPGAVRQIGQLDGLRRDPDALVAARPGIGEAQTVHEVPCNFRGTCSLQLRAMVAGPSVAGGAMPGSGCLRGSATETRKRCETGMLSGGNITAQRLCLCRRHGTAMEGRVE